MITTEKATLLDLIEFTFDIRPMDAEEVYVTTGYTFSHYIGELTKISSTQKMQYKDRLIGIGGAIPDAEGACRGWMLLTTEAEKHKIEFLRWSKKYVEDLLKTYQYIFNDVYKKNQLHIDYLKWLGAKFTQSPVREDFWSFRIERR